MVATLFREYADWLGVDLCFQDFEAELAGLPGFYVPPPGGLWLAETAGGEMAGCVGLRPLPEEGFAELKRLWVRAPYRGTGAGRRLLTVAVEAARAAGYRGLRLDTLPTLTAALALYARFGFRETRPYYEGNPLPGVLYLELDLRQAVQETGTSSG